MRPIFPPSRKTLALFLAVFVPSAVAIANLRAAPPLSISLTPVDTYVTGLTAVGASEIVKFDPSTNRIFVVNAQAAAIEVLDASDLSTPIATIDVKPLGGVVNSVDVSRGVVAAAIEAKVKTDPGLVAFYRTATLELIGTVPAGALPDMVTFSPNGRFVLTANEGEPSADYAIDPLGSVTLIEIEGNFQKLTAVTLDFTAFNGQAAALRAAGIRIYGPNATVAQDFEPEYVAVSHDNSEAYITLQENNAIAVLNLHTRQFDRLLPLGYKDHNLPGNALDPSDRDGAIKIANWPVFGMYQPDSIAAYKAGGRTYLVMANEGDARSYPGFSEEARVNALALDEDAFPNFETLKANPNLGRLQVTNRLGDADGDGDFDRLYVYGGRSFSIRDTKGALIFDSGDALEHLTAAAYPTFFNASNDDNAFDSRSDNKGPEPEGLVLGEIRGRTFAFIGLERIGGVVIYDITDPSAPTFVRYFNNRDLTKPFSTTAALDVGPEGLDFIPADRSPSGKPMLLVGNEISGTTTLYELELDEE